MLRAHIERPLILFLLLFALTFVACDSRPTLDFSSDEAAVTSIKTLSKGLSQEDQKRFKAAMSKIVTRITNETFSESDNMAGAYTKIKSRIHNALNGKTAEEIITLGEKH